MEDEAKLTCEEHLTLLDKEYHEAKRLGGWLMLFMLIMGITIGFNLKKNQD